MAVVERHVGRWPQHDERAFRVDPERRGNRRDRLEVRQVVLLLQARVLEQLGWPDAVAGEALGRHRVGDDDLCRGAAAELVLQPGPLVVERRRARNPEPACRKRELVRAVSERDVEAAAAREAVERAEPRGELARLAGSRAAAVVPERCCRHSVLGDQLEGLPVVAGGDLDLVAAGLEQRHERPEDERVGARGHVDPDAHQGRPRDLRRGGSRAASQAAATFRFTGAPARRSGAARPKPSPRSSLTCRIESVSEPVWNRRPDRSRSRVSPASPSISPPWTVVQVPSSFARGRSLRNQVADRERPRPRTLVARGGGALRIGPAVDRVADLAASRRRSTGPHATTIPQIPHTESESRVAPGSGVTLRRTARAAPARGAEARSRGARRVVDELRLSGC